jgi:hypothetical protein
MINVVYHEVAGQADYFTVHPDISSVSPGAGGSDGIKRVAYLVGVPFVLVQTLEILRIDDGVFALGEGDSAERIAVAAPAVKQHQGDEKTRQPVRHCYRYGKAELNTTAPR